MGEMHPIWWQIDQERFLFPKLLPFWRGFLSFSNFALCFVDRSEDALWQSKTENFNDKTGVHETLEGLAEIANVLCFLGTGSDIEVAVLLALGVQVTATVGIGKVFGRLVHGVRLVQVRVERRFVIETFPGIIVHGTIIRGLRVGSLKIMRGWKSQSYLRVVVHGILKGNNGAVVGSLSRIRTEQRRH